MPTTQQELVRLLYIQHGYKEASRLANVEYDTVRQWAHRFGWNKQLSQVSQATKAVVDNVANDLAEHERKTKLGLAKYAKDQAEHLAKNGKLKDSGAFKNVAGGAAIVHRWDAKSEASNNVVVNVALLGVQPHEISVEARNVESECQDSGE